MDQYGLPTNGTTAAAMHLAARLRQNGHTVRIVTCVPVKDNDGSVFVLKERTFLFFRGVINGHGMALAKFDKKIFSKAVEGADLVHFFMPFSLSRKGKKLCDKLGIASTAAFHLQPENVSYNVGMKFLTNHYYKTWRKFFNKFDHIHAPSEMIRDCIMKRGYTSDIHAVSNGVAEAFCKRPSVRPDELKGKYIIMMSGRLGHEKMQRVLVDGVAKSKYNDKIQLILCGKGPKYKSLVKQSKRVLANPAIIKFCDRESLIDTINYSDLYVHASEIESEAIACMEAFSCGKVPVISDSKISATKQFALHEENLFVNGDSADLAKKIDWFIEHPAEKAVMEGEYLELAKKYRLDICLDQLEFMFHEALSDHKKKTEAQNAERAALTARLFPPAEIEAIKK
jgi:glycosyltransferase involved in cell wall biosynthesis